jgi:hypothetical protein
MNTVDILVRSRSARVRPVLAAAFVGGALLSFCEVAFGGAGQSQPAHTILFRADYRTEMLGFDWLRDSPADWEGTLLGTGCNDGTPAYELRQLPGNPGDESAGQHYWGHAGVLLPTPRFGDILFIRFRTYYNVDNNFRGREGGHATNKMLIVNQGCDGGNCRVVLNTEQYADWGEPDELLKIHYRLGTDGGESQISAPYQERGVWHDVQIMLRYSTAHNRADGEARLWVNNADFQSPTAKIQRILNVGAWDSGSGYIQFGAFNNAPLDDTGSHTWRHCGFEVGATFDPNWDRP